MIFTTSIRRLSIIRQILILVNQIRSVTCKMFLENDVYKVVYGTQPSILHIYIYG